MLNRKQRRDTAIKGKDYYGELTHNVGIANLRVYTNRNMPDGVMIVSPAEGDRLQKLVDEATAKSLQEKVNEKAEVVESDTAENPEEGTK